MCLLTGYLLESCDSGGCSELLSSDEFGAEEEEEVEEEEGRLVCLPRPMLVKIDEDSAGEKKSKRIRRRNKNGEERYRKRRGKEKLAFINLNCCCIQRDSLKADLSCGRGRVECKKNLCW